MFSIQKTEEFSKRQRISLISVSVSLLLKKKCNLPFWSYSLEHLLYMNIQVLGNSKNEIVTIPSLISILNKNFPLYSILDAVPLLHAEYHFLANTTVNTPFHLLFTSTSTRASDYTKNYNYNCKTPFEIKLGARPM